MKTLVVEVEIDINTGEIIAENVTNNSEELSLCSLVEILTEEYTE